MTNEDDTAACGSVRTLATGTKPGAREVYSPITGSTAPRVEPAPTFRVAVEGQARELRRMARDEIYRIAAEALRNAFRHARADHMDVKMRYDDEQFRLRVRDDGKGIEPVVLSTQGVEAACRNAPS